jgi:uncharacterized protein (DUF2236 family)
VRAVHEAVRGTTEFNEPYAANDPHLLRWVHVAELSMFLAGARRYAPTAYSPDELDRYVSEMAIVARELGIDTPPTTVAELEEQLEAFRPELRFVAVGRPARDFVLVGPTKFPPRLAAYATLSTAAVALLPAWARRELGLPSVPLVARTIIEPNARVLAAALRWAVPPVPPAQVARVSPPSTTTI